MLAVLVIAGMLVFHGQPQRAPTAAPLLADAPVPVDAERAVLAVPAVLASTVVAPAAPPSQAASAAEPRLASAPALDELSLLRKLRELRGSDPTLTLELAREGQARFKNGPDVAELSWFVVKSLSDLGRQDEASSEGRKLVHDFPGNSYAEDVYRHLFVNPPTHPSERGYGKGLELE